MPSQKDTATADETELPQADFGVGWVIHTMNHRSKGDQIQDVWAWCKVSPDGNAGYDEVTCTRMDGVTRVDYPDNAVLGAVSHKLWC